MPAATRIAAIANQAHPGVELEQQATQSGARRLGMEVKWLPVHSAGDFPGAFAALARENWHGLIAVPDTLINLQAKAIADFAAQRRIPAVSGWAEFAEAGNFLSYGPSLRGFYRHMSTYVDRLLRGAKAADLPVERPSELELTVNLKAAGAIGLRVPQPLLLRASRLIE